MGIFLGFFFFRTTLGGCAQKGALEPPGFPDNPETSVQGRWFTPSSTSGWRTAGEGERSHPLTPPQSEADNPLLLSEEGRVPEIYSSGVSLRGLPPRFLPDGHLAKLLRSIS